MAKSSRVVALVLALALCGPAAGADVETVLGLWGAQSGPWTGEIEIYGPEGQQSQKAGLRTEWRAVPSGGPGPRTVIKTETFLWPTGDMTSITLMFADTDPSVIKTPYFVNGRQLDFRFAVLSVEIVDASNWTTVIASPVGQEVYEERPAVLRYVRTRSENTVKNTKEVNFLDDGDDRFELRSLIRQTLVK